VTGVTLFSGVVLTKRLELLRELTPNSTTIAMFVIRTTQTPRWTRRTYRPQRATGITASRLPCGQRRGRGCGVRQPYSAQRSALVVGADPFIDTSAVASWR